MDKIIKELKNNLLNKTMSLLEMDNKVEKIAETETSLFDYTECLKYNSCGYYIKKDKNIIVEWEIVKKAEDATETKIKVVNIWED